MLHRRDLCQIVVEAASVPLVSGGAALLEVGGGEPYELPELLKIVAGLYVKKPRLPLGGVLGRSLLPLLERDGRALPAKDPRLADYLALGAAHSVGTTTANPLLPLIPPTFERLHTRV